MLTGSTGATTGTYSYTPYGKLTAKSGSATTNLGYQGQYTDPETGLIYLRARYYDPTTAQFLTRDPLNALTRSAYGYTDNDPLNGSDPSGLESIDLGGGLCAHIPWTGSDNCDHGKTKKWAGNVLAGAGNALTLGQGVDLTARLMGKGKNFTACHADTGSDAYRGGFFGGPAFGAAFAAANAADAAAAADSGGADITFGHGVRHLIEAGLDQTDVESAIEAQVQQEVAGASSTGAFWGRVVVNGQTVEYRAFTLPNGTINVGTYYVP
jgi:RHS repeat-associated protein